MNVATATPDELRALAAQRERDAHLLEARRRAAAEQEAAALAQLKEARATLEQTDTERLQQADEDIAQLMPEVDDAERAYHEARQAVVDFSATLPDVLNTVRAWIEKRKRLIVDMETRSQNVQRVKGELWQAHVRAHTIGKRTNLSDEQLRRYKTDGNFFAVPLTNFYKANEEQIATCLHDVAAALRRVML